MPDGHEVKGSTGVHDAIIGRRNGWSKPGDLARPPWEKLMNYLAPIVRLTSGGGGEGWLKHGRYTGLCLLS